MLVATYVPDIEEGFRRQGKGRRVGLADRFLAALLHMVPDNRLQRGMYCTLYKRTVQMEKLMYINIYRLGIIAAAVFEQFKTYSLWACNLTFKAICKNCKNRFKSEKNVVMKQVHKQW